MWKTNALEKAGVGVDRKSGKNKYAQVQASETLSGTLEEEYMRGKKSEARKSSINSSSLLQRQLY